MLADNRHPFVRSVLADPRWGSITAWAADHCSVCLGRRKAQPIHPNAEPRHVFRTVPLSTVASWYSDKRRKTIPRHWADLIASEFWDRMSGKSRLPANVRTWPNGIL